MSPAAEALFHTAMTLPDVDRLELVGELLDASAEEPSCPELRGEAYLKEIQRRTRESDPSTWLRVEDVIRRANAKHGVTKAHDA